MMGTTHSLSGMTTWLAALPTLDASLGLTPAQTVAGCAMTAGAACLPDLDQGGVTVRWRLAIVPVPKSYGATIARTYGWATAGVAWTLGRAAGGHRNGTHGILGTALFCALAAAAAAAGGWWLGIYVWLLLGVAARALDIAVPGHVTATAVIHAAFMGMVVATLMAVGVDLGEILGWAVLLGVAAHIAGDMLTEQGCPLLWPMRRRYRVGWVSTGSRVETWGRRILLVATLVLAWQVTGLDTYTADLWAASA